jgi:hypothetical protein
MRLVLVNVVETVAALVVWRIYVFSKRSDRDER